MSALIDLRARALAGATQKRPMHVILDDEIRANLTEAREALASLLEHREKMQKAGDLPPRQPQPQPESLADEAPNTPATPDIDRMIERTRETIEAIQQQARDEGALLLLQFRRLTPKVWDTHVRMSERYARKEIKKIADALPEQESQLFLDHLRDAVAPLSWAGAEDADGNAVELSLEEVMTEVLNHAGLQELRQHLTNINRTGQAVPFLLANSGQPATS